MQEKFYKMKLKIYVWVGLLSIALAACQSASSTNISTGITKKSTNGSAAVFGNPSIEVSPVALGEGDYKFIPGDDLKITVRAADAREVELYYQPVTAEDRALKLKSLTSLAENIKDEFVADLKIPEDFNGRVWARVKYDGGNAQETEHLLLAKRGAEENTAAFNQPPDNRNPEAKVIPDSNDRGADTDESARSDNLTGGIINRADLKPGEGDIKITVNVPAFKMTLWQNGKEVKSYYVGVGRKNYPIPIGMRAASRIILNPNWIPPDSEWVRNSPNVEPYQKITVDDPKNPLGKIKIPLGQAYLLHEADKPSDIGNLVSHGCVRVLRDDLFELTELIAKARNLSITKNEIAAARKNSERRAISLNGDVPVDINYDTTVVENGVVSLYPDVYGRKINTPGNLRAELESYGIDEARLDDFTLTKILSKVDGDHKFTVALADIKAGNALGKGRIEPLTPQQAGKNSRKS